MAAAPADVREELRRGLPPVSIDLVEQDARRARATFKELGADQAYCGDPAAASAEEGRELVERLAAMLVDARCARPGPICSHERLRHDRSQCASATSTRRASPTTRASTTTCTRPSRSCGSATSARATTTCCSSSKIGFPLVHSEVDFEHPLRFGDRPEVRDHVLPARHDLARPALRLQGRGEACLEARMTTVCVDTEVDESPDPLPRRVPRALRGAASRSDALRISQLHGRGRPVFSFEFFPPKTDEGGRDPDGDGRRPEGGAGARLRVGHLRRRRQRRASARSRSSRASSASSA